jgi:branched-chain amino acid transport system substrate-binding protein
MRKLLRACAIGLLVGSPFAQPASADDGVIRIGASLRMISEEGAKIGQMVVDEFARINEQGGINGHKVEVTLLNDECKSDKGVANAIKIVSELKAHLVIGSTCSSVTLPIVDITAKAKVPQISPSSTASDVTKKNSAWVFRVPISERFYNAVIGKYVGDNVGKKVAYMWTTDSASQSFAKSMMGYMKETYKVDPVFQAQVNEQEVDYRSYLLKLKASNPDAIAFAGVAAEMARMLTQANEVGIPKSVVRVASSNAGTAAMPELAAANAEGLIYTAAFTAFDDRDVAKKFVAEMSKRYGVPLPDHDFSQAWDMIQIVELALKNAKLKLTDASLADDRTAIRDALASTSDYHGLAAGPISFCADPTPACRDGNRSPELIQYVKGGKDFQTRVLTSITFPADFGL